MSTLAYIGIGSNLGSRLQYLRGATSALSGLAELRATSSVYETAPVGSISQPPFFNAALALHYDGEAEALLAACQRIETDFGRVRVVDKGPRTIDIDLLLFGQTVRTSATLTLPHQELHARAFVLVPLLEIDAQLVDPRDGVRLAEKLSQICPRQAIQRVAGPDALT